MKEKNKSNAAENDANNEKDIIKVEKRKKRKEKLSKFGKKVVKLDDKLGKILFGVMIFISITFFAIAIAPKTLQNDTFYTIKIGEYINDNGVKDLTTDMYSEFSLPYTYPHWLYDWLMFLIYNNFGGHKGIYISTIVLTAILGLCLYAYMNQKTKNKFLSFASTIFSMYLFRDYIAARAQLVTFVLFTLTVYFIEKFIKTEKKKYLIPLIIIPILITNLHCAVFPFYFILFLPYLAEFLWRVMQDSCLDYRLLSLFLKFEMKFVPSDVTFEKIKRKVEKIPEVIKKEKERRLKQRENPYKLIVSNRKCMKWLLIVFILTAFTGFLNPAGTGAYTYTYKIYKGNTTSVINEHQAPTIINNKEFLICLGIVLALLILTDVKIHLSDICMLTGTVILALMSRRQMSMFILFSLPIITKVIVEFLNKYDKETWIKLSRIASSCIVIVAVIAGFSYYGVKKYKEKIDDDYVDISSYPTVTSDWMLNHLNFENIRIYNEYNYGSYLLFRGIPVFIDSRCDLYTPEFNGGRDIFTDAINIANLSYDYKSKFDQYNITHAVLPVDSKLAKALEKEENCSELFTDGRFILFEILDPSWSNS